MKYSEHISAWDSLKNATEKLGDIFNEMSITLNKLKDNEPKQKTHPFSKYFNYTYKYQ